MTAAMMLPTTLPLLELFRRVAAGRRDRRLLMLLLVGGYLAMWGLFGAAAHALDQALARAIPALPWLALNGWAVGAAVLGLAGGYQFTSWKYRCLDRCRTPRSFVIQHWRGTAMRREAFLLGLHHGAFCVGCCWALMLLMFVVGTGNVGVMLGLGLVMAAEKNLSWGRRLGAPLGAALVGWAALIVLWHGTALS
jgi:predicted metal-binding membrane protein